MRGMRRALVLLIAGISLAFGGFAVAAANSASASTSDHRCETPTTIRRILDVAPVIDHVHCNPCDLLRDPSGLTEAEIRALRERCDPCHERRNDLTPEQIRILQERCHPTTTTTEKPAPPTTEEEQGTTPPPVVVTPPPVNNNITVTPPPTVEEQPAASTETGESGTPHFTG